MYMHSMQPLGQNQLPHHLFVIFCLVPVYMLNLSSKPSFDFVASIFRTRFRNTKCAPILSRNSNVLIFMVFSPSRLSYCCNCSLALHTYMTPRGTKMYVGRRTNQLIGAPSNFAHPICENLNPLHISLLIWT